MTHLTTKWSSQSDLADAYGTTAREVGRVLISAGLKRPAGEGPVPEAIEKGLATISPLADGTPHFLWHSASAAKLMEQAGMREVDVVSWEAARIYRAVKRVIEKRETDPADELTRRLQRLPEELNVDVGRKAIALLERHKWVGQGDFVLNEASRSVGYAPEMAEFYELGKKRSWRRTDRKRRSAVLA